jgi:mitogen-activated protein kinase 1/3
MHKSTKEICTPVIEGNYKTYNINGTKFEVPKIYTVVKHIGTGAYGYVCSAIHGGTNEKLAIKKCENVFKEVEDGKRVLRETRLMNFFNHDNLIGIKDILPPREGKSFRDVYFVTPLMDTDLNVVLRSRQVLDDNHYQYFVYQMLRGLKSLHSAQVMHRDMKPGNLLTNISCDLRICDFGLARGITPDDTMTEYVVTRWYRAPELLLMSSHYDTAVDIWSVGCIFVEMLTRKPLFQGKDYFAQLDLICKVLGKPSDADIAFVTDKHARDYVKKMPDYPPQQLAKLVSRVSDPHIESFLSRMLVFNPAKRAPAEELLAHPYLAHLHDEADEPKHPEIFNWEWEKVHMTEADLREGFWKEMLKFHPELQH